MFWEFISQDDGCSDSLKFWGGVLGIFWENRDFGTTTMMVVRIVWRFGFRGVGNLCVNVLGN